MTNEEKLAKEQQEGLDLKYKRIKTQVAGLNQLDTACLLFYLMGFNSRDPKFVDEVDYWLNDPQYGHSAEAKAKR